MAWSESKAWRAGKTNQKFYQALLDDASTAPARNAKRRKSIRPEAMPWEMSKQGLLKRSASVELLLSQQPSQALQV